MVTTLSRPISSRLPVSISLGFLIMAPSATVTLADWKVTSPHDGRQSLPSRFPTDMKTIKTGDKLPDPGKFCWIVGELAIPAEIEGKSVAGQAVGMQISGGDGGEIYVNGTIQSRYDNDHPGLVMVAEQAAPGTMAGIAIQIYGKVQGGENFDEARWVLIDKKRASEQVRINVNLADLKNRVPDGIIGLSQGGGLADYEDTTAAKLKEGGFKWFRTDNILTNALKKNESGKLVYDWTDLDRRVDFMYKMGAAPVLAVSYMPQVLDAVENHDRQSAPNDYGKWEELCYQAAKRCLERDRRVPYWEIWNEVNTGWLKPGPEDTGSETFQKLYEQALGKAQPEREVIRRFEAYCKLYRATAKGVLRADPKAKIGGPALASGPMENENCGHCFHGKGFARGMMLWCRQEKLPLDFVSWHEYFQPPEVIAEQVETFREYLKEFPEFQKSVEHYMITEWNEAWWADRPQDHELGAAWCANTVIRAFIPRGIDFPCFFYVKQNDMGFRGDYSMIMKDNIPKPAYNMAKIFNHMSGRYVGLSGGDDDVCAVAAWDEKKGRLAVVMVNFRDRYALRRNVHLAIDALPAPLASGRWREWIVDNTHSNVWHDQNKAELSMTREGRVDQENFSWEQILPANAIVQVELLAAN